MQGYDYKDGSDRLGTFDTFLTKIGYASPLLDIDVLEYFGKDIAELSRATRAGRLSTVRQFSLYLHALEPDSVLLPPRLMPRESQKVRFFPLSAAKVGALMAATVTLTPDNGIRAACMRFLVGLLYSTGLRISEALALNLGDIKERIVALSPSTREALDEWLDHRAQYADNEPSAPLFVPGPGRRLERNRAHRIFRRLCLECGIDGDPPPRLHDLRHNYACACIARWRETHEDVNALLPALSNAMGHARYFHTELYLHIDAAALQQAGGKFKQHVQQSLEHQP